MTEDKYGVWITSGLLAQFSSTWKMLREAIENCPDEYWYGTDKDWNYSRTAYHIIETQEFYLRNTPEGMEWGKLLGDTENPDLSAVDIYPSKVVLVNYLEELETKIKKYLKDVKLDDLLTKDGFKWFSSVFEKLLYLLRHNAHHLGEMGRMLREWDCQRMKWQ
ncbi:MAG: DinB family protein [Asgard group archaeon]|nr:DinB family protein [Asgard group archaeon]